MASLQLDPAIAWILRAALAALFAAAAVHKIRDPHAFLETFSEYKILPDRFTLPSVIVLVVAEASIAIGLLADSLRSHAGIAGAALLVVYSLAIAVNLSRGRREIDCGCLGPANHQPLSSGLVLRNGVLAIAAAGTSLPVSGRSLQPVDAITLIGGFLALVLLFNAVTVLAALTSPWPNPESIS